MRRLALTIAACFAAILLGASPAAASLGFKLSEVGFREADGSPATEAGSHPFAFHTNFDVKTMVLTFAGEKFEVPDEEFKDLEVNLPTGLAGTPTPVPRCTDAEFLDAESLENACPDSTAVGSVEIAAGTTAIHPGEEPYEATNLPAVPVYNLVPPPGVASKIGFTYITGLNVTIENGVNPAPPYNLQGHVTNISQGALFYGSRLTLWGVPANPAHDEDRGHCAPLSTGKKCEVGLPEVPFLTLPTSCNGQLSMLFEADSWQHPGAWVGPVSASAAALGGCEKLGFAPTIAAKPTTLAAQSPSGLDFSLDVEDEGLTSSGGHSDSDIEKTVVTLPRGMSVNPSQAEGLLACSEAQLERESAFSVPGAGCPQASKIGTIEIETPLLKETILKGSLFVATPYQNKVGSLIALYVVIKDPGLGIFIVQPIKVEPDPRTGQLISTAEDMPQLPFSHFRLHFREGARSPLISPPGCGAFQTEAQLYPWSGNPPVSSTSSFQIISGPNGAPCPAGAAPFHPGFQAGTVSNAAGRYSPFYMRLTRADGEQDMTKFSAVLPPGVVGKVAGIPYCPEAGIARAKSRQGVHGGAEELADPSCPAASRIGRTVGGAGVGSQLTYVPGFLYLAGPFHGDPLSVVSVTPAVAGPFDAGTVVVRVALTLNPRTGEAEADGSASDPIPHILKGIPLNVRDLRVYADRPEFTLNATSCEGERARATLWGGGTALEPLPESPVALAARYQAAGCARLGFKPQLSLRLKGGTKRAEFPGLHLVFRPRHGDANLAHLALRLPHSEFIEQGHIRTICTRVQFAAGAGHGAECPKGSVYGHAKVSTPLLSEPLTGPIYLRSSSHNLPDVVLALQGPPSLPIHIEVDTRIDSVHGGLRAIAAGLPDAPVSRAVVDMQGGQKGLFVNSTNLCLRENRAHVDLLGQNGRSSLAKPPLQVRCGGKGRKRPGRH